MGEMRTCAKSSFIILFVLVVLTFSFGKVFADPGNNCPSLSGDSGLIFYEPFDNDSSVSCNNGTEYGALSYSPGVLGNAVDFNTNKRVCYPMTNNIGEQNYYPMAGTIEFWLWMPAKDIEGFFDIGGLSAPNSMGIFKNLGYMIMEVKNVYNGYAQAWAPSASDNVGRWHHIAVVWQRDNTTQTTIYFKICDNGKCKSSYDGSNTENNISNFNQFCIGWSGWYGYSNTLFDEFKIYNYTKSNSQIMSDYLSLVNNTNQNITPKNCVMGKPQSTGNVQINCSGLYVNGQKFTSKGVGYQPIPIGMTAQLVSNKQSIYDNENIYKYRDFPILREMNANSIRTWDIVMNKTFLDDAYNGGKSPIYVWMGFWINCNEDYSDPAIRQKYIDNFTQYVTQYKDNPAVLGWLIGNENNLAYCSNAYYTTYYYTLANDLAQVAYNIEGPSYHPVGIVNGGTMYLGRDDFNSNDTELNYVDFWGSNVYQSGYTFGDWFKQYSGLTGKPLLITEYGIDAYNNTNNSEYENVQANVDVNMWKEINASNITIGSTLMEYSDEWWKTGSPSTHDLGGYQTDSEPDGVSDEEWYGVVRPVSNGNNVDIMQPRQVYYALKSAWSNGHDLIDADFDGYNNSVDCNDFDSSVYQNLSGYKDKDQDGYTTGSPMQVCSGATLPSGYTNTPSATPDCDDTNASKWINTIYYYDFDNDGYSNPYYGNVTICSNGGNILGYTLVKNDDCNDYNASLYQSLVGYPDMDRDGYTQGYNVSVCTNGTLPSNYKSSPSTIIDCNDYNASLYQYLVGYPDMDVDGYTNYYNLSICSGATLPANYKSSKSAIIDCNDNNASVWVYTNYYADYDKDGHYATYSTTLCTDGSLNWPGYSSTQGDDCNDYNASLYQSLVGYPDMDVDGYTNYYNLSICSGATLPANYKSSKSAIIDCNDNNASVWVYTNYYADYDKDGHYATYNTTLCTDGSLNWPGYSSTQGDDCNDYNASLYQYLVGYPDMDGDGYTNYYNISICSGATLPANYKSSKSAITDCNDYNASVWVYTYYYPDYDKDGYYSMYSAQVCTDGSSNWPGYSSTQGNDCNDYDATVHPGANDLSKNCINDPPTLSVADVSVTAGQTVQLNPIAVDPEGSYVYLYYGGWMTSSTKATTSSDVGEHKVTITASDGSLSVSKNITVIVIGQQDLNVADVKYRIMNGNIYFKITVNNDGTNTLNNIAYRISGIGTPINYYINSLPPGQTIVMTNFPITSGHYNVDVLIDSNNIVNEINEANNDYSLGVDAP